MKHLLAIAFGLITTFTATSALAKDKVLITGDSWGFFLCLNNSLNSVFAKYQFEKMKMYPTCAVTSRVGLRAENWTGTAFDKIAYKLIRYDRSIKVMLLSLGGNDMMNHWNKNMSPEQEQAVFRKIHSDIAGIVARYQAIRPDLKIIVSGYDYPRFTPNHPIAAYREAFDQMGQPLAVEVNGGLHRFSAYLSQLGRQANVYYIHHLGVAQYHFGNPEDGITPGQTLHPDYISNSINPVAAGGSMNSLSPKQSMLTVGPIVDAFHFNQGGYELIGEHIFRNYLRHW